jgi:hypothetical protein
VVAHLMAGRSSAPTAAGAVPFKLANLGYIAIILAAAGWTAVMIQSMAG